MLLINIFLINIIKINMKNLGWYNEFLKNSSKVDLEIEELIKKELKERQESIELIASENFTSKAVMEAMGSFLTNKYAEGYPNKKILWWMLCC